MIDEISSDSDDFEASNSIHVIVGGRCFSLSIEDIERHPCFYFEGMIKKEWRPDASKPIPIDRDGSLFRYVADYLFYGIIPNGRYQLDVTTLQLIQTEADFYNLPDLVAYCEEFAVVQVKSLIQSSPTEKVECEYDSTEPTDLVNVLSSVWSPFCLKGFADHPRHKLLFKNSTPYDLKVSELLGYSHSSCDKANFNCFEIEGSRLNPDTVDSIKKRIGHIHLCPRRKLDLNVSKLVIYTEGGYCSEHRSVVHSDGQVGSLLYILNTGFKGGHITVTQNEVNVSVCEPREWLAIQAGAVFHVDTVLTGTLVYIEFGVFSTDVASLCDCWDHDVGEMLVPPPLHTKPMNITTREEILTTLHNHSYGEVVITLPTLYPLLNSDPDCLVDGDRELYGILQQAGYDVSMVLVAVHRVCNNGKILLDDSYVVGYDNANSAALDTTTPISSVENKTDRENKMKIIIPIVATANWKKVSSGVDSIVSNGSGSTSAKYTYLNKDIYLTTGLRVVRQSV